MAKKKKGRFSKEYSAEMGCLGILLFFIGLICTGIAVILWLQGQDCVLWFTLAFTCITAAGVLYFPEWQTERRAEGDRARRAAEIERTGELIDLFRKESTVLYGKCQVGEKVTAAGIERYEETFSALLPLLRVYAAEFDNHIRSSMEEDGDYGADQSILASVEQMYRGVRHAISKQSARDLKVQDADDSCSRCAAYFPVLGLKASASIEDVETAHRILAKRFHPDRFESGDPRVRGQAEEEMKTINAAYNHIVECRAQDDRSS